MEAEAFLIKPASGLCNMRCSYCFYADVSDSREVKDRGMMSVETAECLIKKAFSEVTGFCSFAFQGGEPMLAGLPFFAEFAALVKKHNTKNIPVSYALQTNGLLMDEKWADFFRENGFLIGLSIDAGKEIHDSLRLDASQKGTHRKCMEAVRILKRKKVEFNILSVITRQLAREPKAVWQFFKKEKFGFLQCIPCLDGLGETRGGNMYSLDAALYGSFLCDIFDLWYEDFVRGNYISVRNFDNYIRMLLGALPENCAMSGECKAYALIEADGTVYPCDFYALDEYCLGNIKEKSLEEMLRGEKARAFVRPSKQKPPECEACWAFFLCRGGCRRDREPMVGKELSRNYYCDAYKRFFHHALPRMREVARTVQASAPKSAL